MGDWIFDYDDNEPLYKIDDDFAVDSDGHIVQNAGDNWGFDHSTGEFHVTSGWDSSEGGSDDDDDSSWYDDSIFDEERTSEGNSTSYSDDPPSGRSTYQKSNNTYSSYQPSGRPQKTDAQEHVGCAAIFWGFIAGLVVTYVFGVEGNHPIAYVIWAIVAIIVAAFLISSNKSGSSSGSGSGGASARSGGVSSPSGSECGDDYTTMFYYCEVVCAGSEGSQYYRSTDSSISAGNYVLVPCSDGKDTVPAKVVDARFYIRAEVPSSLYTTPFVRKRIDAETYFALVEKAKKRSLSEEETEDGSGNAPEKENGKGSREGISANTKILLVTLICLVIAVLIAAVVDSMKPDGNTPAAVAATADPEPAETAEPTQTPKPTPTAARLTDNETDAMIVRMTEELEDICDEVVRFSEDFSAIEPDSLSADDIHAQEQIWSGYLEKTNGLLAELDEITPSSKYANAWDELKNAAEETAYISDLMSDWDDDGDGRYVADEVTFVYDNATFWALYLQMCLDDLHDAYNEAAATPQPTATPKRATPTPRPTATPRRSSSKTNSDPYNAKDYSNPDFFYDDYYDDFYDYDEAEEYWEDYGDW